MYEDAPITCVEAKDWLEAVLEYGLHTYQPERCSASDDARELPWLLQDGALLCHALQTLDPACLPDDAFTWHAEERDTCIRNVDAFIASSCARFEIPRDEMFDATDLCDNVGSEDFCRVLFGIYSLWTAAAAAAAEDMIMGAPEEGEADSAEAVGSAHGADAAMATTPATTSPEPDPTAAAEPMETAAEPWSPAAAAADAASHAKGATGELLSRQGVRSPALAVPSPTVPYEEETYDNHEALSPGAPAPVAPTVPASAEPVYEDGGEALYGNVESVGLGSAEAAGGPAGEAAACAAMATSGLSGDGSEKKLGKQKMVLDELVDTERSYLERVQSVMEGYYHQIPTEKMPTEDKETIFGNLQHVCAFSSAFLEQLDAAMASATPLAAVCSAFVQMRRKFAVYTEYCVNMPLGQQLLQLYQQDPSFNALLQGCKMMAGHQLDLSSFLLRPFERMLKYPLLLRELERTTAPDGPGAPELAAAAQCIAQVTAHMNETKRWYESMEKVMRIQLAFADWGGDKEKDLTDFGQVEAEGPLKVADKRDGKPVLRYCFLLTSLLLVCKEAEFKEDAMRVKARLEVSKVSVNKLRGNDCAFELARTDSKKSVYVFHAKSLAEREQWTAPLERSIMSSLTNFIVSKATLKQQEDDLIMLDEDQKLLKAKLFNRNKQFLTRRKLAPAGGGGSGGGAAAAAGRQSKEVGSTRSFFGTSRGDKSSKKKTLRPSVRSAFVAESDSGRRADSGGASVRRAKSYNDVLVPAGSVVGNGNGSGSGSGSGSGNGNGGLEPAAVNVQRSRTPTDRHSGTSLAVEEEAADDLGILLNGNAAAGEQARAQARVSTASGSSACSSSAGSTGPPLPPARRSSSSSMQHHQRRSRNLDDPPPERPRSQYSAEDAAEEVYAVADAFDVAEAPEEAVAEEEEEEGSYDQAMTADAAAEAAGPRKSSVPHHRAAPPPPAKASKPSSSSSSSAAAAGAAATGVAVKASPEKPARGGAKKAPPTVPTRRTSVLRRASDAPVPAAADVVPAPAPQQQQQQRPPTVPESEAEVAQVERTPPAVPRKPSISGSSRTPPAVTRKPSVSNGDGARARAPSAGTPPAVPDVAVPAKTPPPVPRKPSVSSSLPAAAAAATAVAAGGAEAAAEVVKPRRTSASAAAKESLRRRSSAGADSVAAHEADPSAASAGAAALRRRSSGGGHSSKEPPATAPKPRRLSGPTGGGEAAQAHAVATGKAQPMSASAAAGALKKHTASPTKDHQSSRRLSAGPAVEVSQQQEGEMTRSGSGGMTMRRTASGKVLAVPSQKPAVPKKSAKLVARHDELAENIRQKRLSQHRLSTTALGDEIRGVGTRRQAGTKSPARRTSGVKPPPPPKPADLKSRMHIRHGSSILGNSDA